MDKKTIYQELYIQIKALIEDELDLIANLSNISSVLHYAFQHHWTGFYLVKGQELVLGPFQGPVACTRIAFGKGVCGKAWAEGKPLIVDNVHEFKGHIACSAFSNSEIVIPLISNNNVWGVLDIDSIEYANFDAIDEEFLNSICSLIKKEPIHV